MRIYITGAAGSGTSTLGRALADTLGIAHFDMDQVYWLPSDPPYTKQRPLEACRQLLRRAFAEAGSWTLSGHLGPWGKEFYPQFEMVIFLLVPTEVRLARLLARERQGPHAAHFAPGGAGHESFLLFYNWAAAYDTGGTHLRSRAHHERFLSRVSCPVLRLDGERPTAQLVEESLAALAAHGLSPGQSEKP